MSNGLLFVTASNVDYRIVNRFLLYAFDWEYGSESSFHLITSKNNDPEFEKFKDSDRHDLSATKPGDVTTDNFTNEWVGFSLKDIETYALESDKTKRDGDGLSLFLVLDDKGAEDHTCVIVEKYVEYDDDVEPIEKEDRERKHDYNKIRVPWDEVYLTWCNLNIANMDFEDFTDEEGPDGEGFWHYRNAGGNDLSEENLGKRDKEIKKFEEEGKA